MLSLAKVRQVKVGPYVYDVEYDNDTMAVVGGNGTAQPDVLRVLLASNTADDVIRETAAHEVLGHAVWHLTRLVDDYDDGPDNSPGERIINRLIPAQLSVLKDNPKFTDFILGR